MTRAWLLAALVAGGCGSPELTYTDPEGGALRLVRNPASDARTAVLDFVVGDRALTGYAAGFDLALEPRAVRLDGFTPGPGLPPGDAPIAAGAALPTEGPLAGMLVTAQSQKAAGAGAVAQDTELAPGTVLYSVRLALRDDGFKGVVFDGSTPGFVLTSGGLRTRAGVTVVESRDVAVGTLEVR